MAESATRRLFYPPELVWVLFSGTYEGIYFYVPPLFDRNISVTLLSHTGPMFGPVPRLDKRPPESVIPIPLPEVQPGLQ